MREKDAKIGKLLYTILLNYPPRLILLFMPAHV